MIGAKWFDMVIGVDIHWVNIPAPPAPPIPTPLPHPFMGLIFDPAGLAMGAAMSGIMGAFKGVTLINKMPGAATGTEVTNKLVMPHIFMPPGLGWAPMSLPMPGNKGDIFTGSKTVYIGGSNAARLGDKVLTCSEPVPLPTSTVIAIPMGPPVLIGGPPAMDWGINDRLQQIEDSLTGTTIFAHDAFGNFAKATYSDGISLFRAPDAIGNLYRSPDRTDRKYGPAGQLLEASTSKGVVNYEYDVEGNLKKKIEPGNKEWNYTWNSSGMLSEVKRPDGKRVKFTYDPLGRRMSKSFNGRITKWVWDGNVLLHEWVEHFDDVNEEDEIPDSLQSNEISTASLQAQLDGRPSNGPPDECVLPLPTTWLFDPDTFAHASKIVGDKHYSIITDHLGTPLSMFDEMGVQTWGAELDIFGSVKNLQGDRNDCPFRYPGQYEDCEIGLYYNRFRYYDPEGGEYVSQDPIGLEGCINLYAYVVDVNSWIDIIGLNQKPESAIDWEKRFNLMAPGEKYNAALGKLHKVAKRNGWVQDNRLTRLNNRVVYSDTNGKFYAFDTQHGRFEYLDNRGRHLGEFDIDGKLTKPADTSGKHNIRCG